MTHHGILIRFGLRGMPGPLLAGDSDHLYLVGKYSGALPCTPLCLPNCDLHGWLSVTAELVGAAADVVFEIKPVDLPDDYPDPDEVGRATARALAAQPPGTVAEAAGHVDVGALVGEGLDIGEIWARAASADAAMAAELQHLADGDDPEA